MKKVFTQMLIPKKSVGFLLRLGGMCLFLFISFLVHAQGRGVSDPIQDEGGGVTTDAYGKHLTCLVIIENELNQI
jgi:hypothetical protein